MTSPIDLCDVPGVTQQELSLPMTLLVEAERALCLLRGASAEDRRVVEDAFWEAFDGTTARGVAILVRFWCLVDAFSGQRFKAMLMNRGYSLIAPAVGASASMRLNAHWGFNPQRLLWGIQDVARAAAPSDPVGPTGPTHIAQERAESAGVSLAA